VAVTVIRAEVWHRYSCGCEEDEDFLDADGPSCCERCRTHRQALDRTERHEVARWIVFLYSDLEFEWPVGRLEHALAWYAVLALGWLGMVLGLGSGVLLDALLHIAWLASSVNGSVSRRLGIEGDRQVWPFFRQFDFEATVRQPILFGSRAA
jgi:hypothetical protein